MEIKEFLTGNESDIKRKIHILELISAEKRWYTYTEISQAINASNKTIKKDLAYIQEFLPRTWSIMIKKGYGVQIEMPFYTSIQEMISLFFRESLTFKILDSIFRNEESTVHSLAENLYIQPNKIVNILKKIEKEISQFGLEIKKNPVRIVGAEAKIIYMFAKLYSSTYLNDEWPFQQRKEIINKCITEIEKYLNIILTVDSKHQFSYFIAILLIRKKQGYKIKLANPFSKFNINTPLYNKVSLFVENVKNDFSTSFSIYEKIMITIIIKSLDYRFKYPLKEKNQEIQLFQQQEISIYKIVKDFISMLDETLKSTFIKDEEFIYSLILHFRKTLYLLHIYSYVKPKEEAIHKHIEDRYTKTFHQVREVYKKWIKKHQIASYVPNKEIVNIVLQIEATRIKNDITPKKVIIITKEGECWKSYISAVLKEKFGEKLEFISISSSENIRENELAEGYSIDFVISTIPLNLKSNPVIQIQPIITERDLSNIRYYINQ
ncbi:capsule biosynthesis protein [Bacillus cereus]|nr:capsule biosynthesis protein [Bacillus cereus]PGU64708.1 capsule biosynthesis protein [Bacillus cereus]